MNGKGHQLSANITAAMKDALEAEAELTGRSVSAVAELWLERGRLGYAQDQLAIKRAHGLTTTIASTDVNEVAAPEALLRRVADHQSKHKFGRSM